MDYLQKAKSWANESFFDSKDRDELTALIEKNQQTELRERFELDLEFGTGGMRGVVGLGTNRMNVYNIKKATQALCLAVKNKNPVADKIAVSFDSRLSSKDFSRAVCETIAGNGMTAILAPKLSATPLLSFAVRHYHCQGGIMITASHNPPKYNGFKAYGADGAQVTPPMDGEIIELFQKIQWSDIKQVPFDQAKDNGLIQYFDQNFYQSYLEILKKEILNPEILNQYGEDYKIIYSPLHGTGGWAMEEFMPTLGISNIIQVPSQKDPDGNFPTTPSPNPEDPKALTEAVQLMHKEGAQLVLASDPDTDRMGVAQNINGDTYYFNGNEIATLMLYYKLTQMKEKNLIKDNPLVIKTIVTSPLQQTICDAFNVELVNTLTGFKWMGGYLNQLDEQKKDYQFVFASEESFGSMTHHKVRDKDGISSVALFCELAIYYDQQGKNLVQVLDDIYTEFGFHQESLLYNVYEGLGGKDKISRIMDYFRREVTQDFCGQKIKIFEDYLEGVKKISGKKETLNFPSSNVLGLHFQNNDQLYLRPSGTEPKIKFYTMVNVTEGNLEEKKKVAAEKIALIEKKIAEICDAI